MDPRPVKHTDEPVKHEGRFSQRLSLNHEL